MIRKEIFENEKLFNKMIPLDYFIQIIGSIPAGMLYIHDYMCVYRFQSNGSWTTRMKQNIQSRIEHTKQVNLYLMELDKLTDYIYHTAIKQHIQQNEISVLVMRNDFKSIKKLKHKAAYSRLSPKEKFKIKIKRLLYMIRRNNV